MEKLCRICLIENVRVYCIVNTYLHEMYEKLVEMPFQTIDSRPVHICYMCHARLKNCYQLKSICLQSEKFFSEMLMNNKLKQTSEQLNRLTILNCNNINIVPDAEDNPDDAYVNIFYDQIKIEPLEMIDVAQVEEKHRVTNCHLGVGDVSSKVDNDYYSSQTVQVKTSENDELCLGEADFEYIMRATGPNDKASLRTDDNEKKINSEPFIPRDSEPSIPRDICLKSVEIVLPKLEVDDSETSAPVPKKTYPAELKENHQSTSSKLETNVRVGQNTNNLKNLQTELNKPNITGKMLVDKYKEVRKRLECNVCGKYFNGKGHLIEHVRTHTAEMPFKCYLCVKGFMYKSWLDQHIRTHTAEKPFSCNVCGKDFNDKGYLVIHIRTHTGEKPYKCNICEKRFNNSSNLTRHIRTHNEHKPFTCNVCGKDFNDKRYLNRHIRTHTGEKPYKCNVCGRCFIRTCDLTKHIRTHTGEKPFECLVCRKCFKDKSTLNRHIRTHTADKPFECDICWKRFKEKSDIIRHIRTHTGDKRFECQKPFECSVCEKRFKDQNNLTRHIHTHTDEKRFECNICGKRVKYNRNLINHIRTHTGQNRFECNVCGKRFNYKSNLIRHIRAHTGEIPF